MSVLLDELMPHYDVVERHRMLVRATPSDVYAAIRQADLAGGPVTRLLFMLRALPAAAIALVRSPRAAVAEWRERRAHRGLRLADFERAGFRIVGERAPEELVIGLLGRFWTPRGALCDDVSVETFRAGPPTGQALAGWNFSVRSRHDGLTELRTETRVLCAPDAWTRFRLYWFFVRPGSGMIRRSMLHAIRRRAEKMHLRFSVLLFLVVAGCGLHPSELHPAPRPEVLREVEALVAAGVEEQQPPGASLVVMRRDAIVLERGYGVESVQRADAVTPATVFELGSISKQFTAALILKLAEEGRLSIDDPVARRLPDFTDLPPGLTIRHLLTHTSGMREVFAQPELGALLVKPGTPVEQFEAVARKSPADFAPGERWAYSNVNYLMLTFIAERAAGQRLEDALTERFFRPLALSSIRACESHPGAAPGAARGHLRGAQGPVPHPPENFHLFVGAGGLCGSAVDLARWTRALATGKVIKPSSYAQMIAPAPLTNGRTADYGMGMVLVSPDGARRLGHGGYGGGFSAQAAYYPERETTIVLMLNRFVFPEYVERRIARRLLGLPEATLREVALSADERKRYAGTYDIGVRGSTSAVVERDGKLWFENRPLPPQPLVYVGNDEFVREGQPYGYRLYFGPDVPDREVRILGMGMMTWYGRRRP